MTSANQSPHGPRLFLYLLTKPVIGSRDLPTDGWSNKAHGPSCNFLEQLLSIYKTFQKFEPIWLDIGREIIKTT